MLNSNINDLDVRFKGVFTMSANPITVALMLNKKIIMSVEVVTALYLSLPLFL
jgi:hypothetical protein